MSSHDDMRRIIAPKSDQLNADDLIGGPITIVIDRVELIPDSEQPVTIHWRGAMGRPWKPCKSMSRVLVAAWGLDVSVYPGRSVTLYRDPRVKWGGLEVGGIRIQAMSHIQHDLPLGVTVSRGRKEMVLIRRLADTPAEASARAAEAPAARVSPKVERGLRELLAGISGHPDAASAQAWLAEAAQAKRVSWLEANAPDLMAEVTAAVAALEEMGDAS